MEIHPKRWEILKLLRERGGATVVELAKEVGLAPITVRHHLAILEKESLVTNSRIRQKIGRPYYVYVLTREGNEVFPHRYMTLTERILKEIAKLQGTPMLRRIFETIGKDIARDYREHFRGKGFNEKIEALRDILDIEGFVVEIESRGQGVVFKILSCPYREVVKDHPSLCFLDLSLIRESIGADPVSLERQHDGKPCLILIPSA